MLTQLVCVWTVKKVYLKNYKKLGKHLDFTVRPQIQVLI